MVTVTTAWLDPKEERPLLQSLPQAGALLPSLDKAHRGLLETQVAVDQVETELSLLQKAQAKLDARHDRKVRGPYNVLTGLADLADDEAEATSDLALGDALTPHGLEVVRWSYADEVSEAELVESRLTAGGSLSLGAGGNSTGGATCVFPTPDDPADYTGPPAQQYLRAVGIVRRHASTTRLWSPPGHSMFGWRWFDNPGARRPDTRRDRRLLPCRERANTGRLVRGRLRNGRVGGAGYRQLHQRPSCRSTARLCQGALVCDVRVVDVAMTILPGTRCL